MRCFIKSCADPSGPNVLCEYHRHNFRTIPIHTRKRVLIRLHELVCEKAYDDERDQYQCFHCKDWFAKNEIIGDHYPDSKGAKPSIKFNIDCLVPSCKPCNRSDSPNRKKWHTNSPFSARNTMQVRARILRGRLLRNSPSVSRTVSATSCITTH